MSKPTKWEDLLKQLTAIEAEFNRSYKCLNKTQLPSEKTQAKHLNNLVLQHNTIAATLRTFYSLLSPPHKQEVEILFQNLKSKLTHLLRKLEIRDTVPADFTSLLDLNFIEEESDEESNNKQGNSLTSKNTSNADEPNPNIASLASNANNNSNMPNMTPVEFLNIASKLLPDFDGKFENLQRFLDALNLVDTIKEATHESLAITLIKSKLTGTARNLIHSETTIEAIKNTLTAKVKGETTQVVMAKLLNAKQSNKSSNTYAKEIEEMTKLLQNAYISDGLTPELAEKYSTQTAVKAVIKNSRSEKVKLVMQAGQFASMNEAMTKFIEVSSDADEHKSINYIQNRNQKYGNRSNFRGRGRGNYNRGNRGRRQHYRGNDSSYNQNYSQNNNSNRGRSSNVRHVESVSENGTAPQSAQLGNI